MPIYEFKCANCGKEFEEMTGLDEEAPKCPECGSQSRRLMSVCRRFRKASSGDYGAPASGGGCGGCMGGNCASCGR